jgi:hypothetical protein
VWNAGYYVMRGVATAVDTSHNQRQTGLARISDVRAKKQVAGTVWRRVARRRMPTEFHELVTAVELVSVPLSSTAGERRDLGNVMLCGSLLTVYF